MDQLNFGILLSAVLVIPAMLILERRAPIFQESPYDTRSIKFLRFVLVLLLVPGGFLGVILFVAPPLYKLLLEKSPLLLARLSWVGMAALMMIALLAFFWQEGRKFFSRLPERIRNASYADQKLGQVLAALLVTAVGAVYLAIPTLALASMIREWDNEALWNDIVEEMKAPPPEARQTNVMAMIAARKTCLYEEKSMAGPCLYPQSKGSLVSPYWDIAGAKIDQQGIHFTQKGDAVYVASLDPDTLLQPGWVRSADYDPSTDFKGELLAILKVLFKPEVLKEAGISLLIGSLISLVIVWVTKGAAEHYMLLLVFLFSMATTAARYSIGGGMIVPSHILWLVILPLAAGSAVEDVMIRLLRKIHR